MPTEEGLSRNERGTISGASQNQHSIPASAGTFSQWEKEEHRLTQPRSAIRPGPDPHSPAATRHAQPW
jgi:hypothetical protein